MKKSSQGVVKRYLTIVPAISNALEGPTYGSNDTEDTCDPITATEDADRLDYARGSSTKTRIVGSLVRVWAGGIANLPWDTEDPKKRRLGPGSKEAGRRVAHVNREKQVPSTEKEINVWESVQGQGLEQRGSGAQ